MKYLVLSLLLVFVDFISSAQISCSHATKNEIIDVINWKISSDNAANIYNKIKQIDKRVIQWDSSDYEVVNFIDTLLTEKDKLYMKRQLDCYLNKNDIWKQEDFSMVKIVRPKSINKIKNERDHYWAYSLPIFSEDHSCCIIKYQFQCGGGLCASSMTTLFKRTDKGWVKIKKLFSMEA